MTALCYNGEMATIVKYLCKTCGKKVEDYASNKRSSFCSLPCYWESKRGSVGHWFGKKRPNISGVNSGTWKGDNVGYVGVHLWLRREFGTPRTCEHCGDATRKMYHWANISDKYTRDRTDWLRLCVPCHSKFDRLKKVV